MNKVFISCKESRIENNRSFYGCFSLGSFDYGLSLTVANALRRTLLAECPGLGIVSVTIENVTHEYSTLPGVRESVLDMLLNLKEIVLKKTLPSGSFRERYKESSNITYPEGWQRNNSYQSINRAKQATKHKIAGFLSPAPMRGESATLSQPHPLGRGNAALTPLGLGLRTPVEQENTKQEEECLSLFHKNASLLNERSPVYKNNLSVYEQVGSSYLRPVVGYLKVKGPGVIRAKDLILPSFIQCVDPEQYIATLSEDGTLCMKFIIMEGKNDYIQKKNSFINLNVVKKRKEFLTELFQVSSLALPKSKPFSFVENEPQVQSLKESSKVCESQVGELSSFPTSPFLSKSNKHSKISFNHSAQPEVVPEGPVMHAAATVERSSTVTQQSLFRNSLPLYLDTVFNPVTKVNYIIEENLNKLVDDSKKKTMLVDEITSLIESSHFLKENLPFLAPYASIEKKPSNLVSHSGAMVEQSSMPLPEGLASPARELQPKEGHALFQHEKLDAHLHLLDKQLSNLVNIYEKSNLNDFHTSLHPLQKETKNHTIILEIWTNGSIHPSEVLKIGLNKLSSIFLQFQKTFSTINFSPSSSLTLHSK